MDGKAIGDNNGQTISEMQLEILVCMQSFLMFTYWRNSERIRREDTTLIQSFGTTTIVSNILRFSEQFRLYLRRRYG